MFELSMTMHFLYHSSFLPKLHKEIGLVSLSFTVISFTDIQFYFALPGRYRYY